MRRALLAPLALGLLVACSGEGNDGQPDRNFEFCLVPTAPGEPCPAGSEAKLWDQLPWANHGTPATNPDTGKVVMSNTPVYPPIAGGVVDPGSRPVDCSGLDDIELSPYYVDTFEPVDATASTGIAPGWSSYDDASDASFRTPGDADWYAGLSGTYGNSATFGMATDNLSVANATRPAIEMPQCLKAADGSVAPNAWALHYRGGRFNYYGGGMAHPFTAGRKNPDTNIETPYPDGADFQPATVDIFPLPASGESFQNSHNFVDLSGYHGVVFWARRGPEGATSMLVGLQTKHTSDDLARENQFFCKRIKPCKSECVNGFECITNPDGEPDEVRINRCMPPGLNVAAAVANVALREFLYPRCGASTCEPYGFYPDPDFAGSECKAYSFTGLETGTWCYGDTPPPAPAERCGDGFVNAISLSTDWQLYKLPFESFRQVGFAKKAPTFDLNSIYSIAFQFTVGYTDVYVDNVSFYRNK